MELKKKNMSQLKKIAVFYHACCINDWKRIVSDQVKTFRESGLPKAAQDIHVHVSGIQDGFRELWSSIDNVTIQENPDKDLYEEYALSDLQKYCSQHDAYVFYFHSKGVRIPVDSKIGKNVWEWRKYLEYFDITQWRNCVEKLKTYDCCGAQYKEIDRYGKDSKHFAGNYWWATSDYIRTLPDVTNLPHRDNMYSKGRIEQEHWIGRNTAHKAYSFFFKDGALYNLGIKREEYVGT
jgi:hypothetical protein